MNVAYLNGKKIVDLHCVSLYNASFLYGINCFEGVRGYWQFDKKKISFFDLEEHITRLYASANAMIFKKPVERNQLCREIKDIVMSEAIVENVYMRITFFVDSETSWSETENISYIVSLRSMSSVLGKSPPAHLTISKYRRIGGDAMPPSVKAGANYLNSRYALLEAKQKGFDGAVFLTKTEFIAESTGSCIFFIKKGGVYTPSTDCDILIGVTRNRIIALCKALNVPVFEKKITPKSLTGYESAFLAGTMIEMKPIAKIDTVEFDCNHILYLRIVNTLFNYIHEVVI